MTLRLNRRGSRLALVIAETCLVVVFAVLAARLIGFRIAPAENAAPSIVRVSPNPQDVGMPVDTTITVFFSESLARDTVDSNRFTLQAEHGHTIPTRVAYDPVRFSATLAPLSPLEAGTTYRVTVKGAAGGVTDRRSRPLHATRTWTFTTGVAQKISPTQGPGGPLLIVTSRESGFSQYYPEILRAEGLNEFSVCDVTQLNRALLDQYDVVLLGDVPIQKQQAKIVEDFVRRGGNLIAMHPDQALTQAMGISAANPEPLQDAYLAIEPTTKYGAGLVHDPIQFHGPATLYQIPNAMKVATLYTGSATTSPYPAVATMQQGRGIVAVFAYDLARSVVYTRQGNPDWSGEERDGLPPIRADDLFYGAADHDPQPDWVDPQKIAIPQADEQQRLLANLILLLNASKMPLPRFWYLPRGAKAAIIMTGDDHDGGGTFNRFQSYLAKSPPQCSANDWECLHATAYIFDGAVTPEHAATLAKEGFEIALHLSTDCKDWGEDSSRNPTSNGRGEKIESAVNTIYARQLAAFTTSYPALPPPTTVRTHCIVWGDYDSQPKVELRHGIRLDTNYYYWPPKWVHDRPGLFTGSGMPMRFATIQGVPIDVYQAPTQMTDESHQTYPATIDTLLQNALGPNEYFGVFTANLHNDLRYSAAADAVVSAALAHHVPVVSAVEMLRWLDGRNNSSFQYLQWSGNKLGFTIAVASGGNGMEALLPARVDAGPLTSLAVDGVEVKREPRHFGGLDYAAFAAEPGHFIATYGGP